MTKSRLFFLFIVNTLCATSSSQLDCFHICAVASKEHKNLDKLIQSCQQHQINLEILGMNEPYLGNGTKLLRIQEYIENLEEDEIVMVVDAYDVLIVADKEVILQKFLDMQSPLIMSTEKNCFPRKRLANRYPNSPTPFKYINTGGFIGYVRNLKALLKELSPINLKQGDQGQVSPYFLKNQYAFTLDYHCNIFLSLYEVDKNELEIDTNKGVVHCHTTLTDPCVIHANGKSFNIWDQVYLKLVKPRIDFSCRSDHCLEQRLNSLK